MAILIKCKKITFSKENLSFVRLQYPQLVLDYIVENMDEYLDLVREGDNNLEELRKLLGHENLGNQYKIQLVDLCNIPISIQGLEINDKIKTRILDKKFDVRDMAWLIAHYDIQSAQIKGRIYNLVKSHMEIAVQFAHDMSEGLRQKIFNTYDIDKAYKLQVLEGTVNKMNEGEVIESLRAIDADQIADNLEGKPVKVANNTDNTRVLTILANRSIIQTPKVATDDRYYETITF